MKCKLTGRSCWKEITITLLIITLLLSWIISGFIIFKLLFKITFRDGKIEGLNRVCDVAQEKYAAFNLRGEGVCQEMNSKKLEKK